MSILISDVGYFDVSDQAAPLFADVMLFIAKDVVFVVRDKVNHSNRYFFIHPDKTTPRLLNQDLDAIPSYAREYRLVFNTVGDRALGPVDVQFSFELVK